MAMDIMAIGKLKIKRFEFPAKRFALVAEDSR
jgi:hypothetical protein